MARIVAIVGQTASGKTTLAEHLESAGYPQIPEYTTRPARAGEKPKHISVSDTDFVFMKGRGEFAVVTEYDTVHGLWRYGIRWEDLDVKQNSVLSTNPVHAAQLKAMQYNPFIVLLDIPQEVCVQRALDRGDRPEEIWRRIAADSLKFDQLVMDGAVDLRITKQTEPKEICALIVAGLGKSR